jgi:hypothetical protein
VSNGTTRACAPALIVVAILLGAGYATTAWGHDKYGTRKHPLEGRRYETMRGLAEYLDQAARAAVDGANRSGTDRRPSEGKVLSSIRAFGRRADGFHRMTDDYQASLFDVPELVEDLSKRARSVNGRLRSARVLESTYADWDAVLDVLARMRQLLAGGEVEVPMARADWHLEDEVAGSGQGWLSMLSVERRHEFRQLAGSLHRSAKRAHHGAKRTARQHPDGAQASVDALRQFVDQARALRERTAVGQVDPRLVGPVVSQLLEDARRTDRSLRDGQRFRPVWPEWGRTIILLEQMDRLVRS